MPPSPGRPRAAQPRSGARASRPYHHPDLRQALVDAALDILRAGGPEALTLRGVARAAGVSQTAPYRHFADRAALIAAVAEDGFRRLHARMLAAASRAAAQKRPGTTERAGLQQLGLEYVRFALEHPAEYRIMFGGELSGERGSSLPPTLAEARGALLNLLRGGIAALQTHGLVRAGDASVMALSAWALMHGLVMLTLDGQAQRVGGATPHELAEAATTLLMFGMAERGE